MLDAISSLTSSLTRIGPKDVVEGRGDSWVPRLEERRSVGGQNGSEENAVNGVLKDIAWHDDMAIIAQDSRPKGSMKFILVGT